MVWYNSYNIGGSITIINYLFWSIRRWVNCAFDETLEILLPVQTILFTSSSDVSVICDLFRKTSTIFLTPLTYSSLRSGIVKKIEKINFVIKFIE